MIDHGLPLGLIAPACMDHPLLQALSPTMLERSTRDCTVLMLLNAGSFQASIWRLGARYSVPLFGSSANLSVSGTKMQGGEHRARGHSRCRRHHRLWIAEVASLSRLLDIRDCRVVRQGSCFEANADVLRRQFGVALVAADRANRRPDYSDRLSDSRVLCRSRMARIPRRLTPPASIAKSQ